MGAQAEGGRAWERQPGESSSAYESFTEYLQLGAKRSIRAVAHKVGKSENAIGRLCSKHNWVERSRAYDNEQARETYENAVQNAVESNKRQILLARLVRDKALAAVKLIDPAKLTPKETIELLKFATALETTALDRAMQMARVPEAMEEESNTEDVVIYVPDNGMGVNEIE